MTPPPSFGAVLTSAPDVLTPPALYDLLPAPESSDVSARQDGVPGIFEDSTLGLLPSVSDAWMALRRTDPSLQLTDWRQVFNVTRLGVFVVPLRDDPAEETNILLAAQAVNGVIIAPGHIFSFNRTVGERTPERGYQDGLMFSQGQIIRGTGGGICLVSTALYNAALQAGLALIERHPHSGVVGYAPPGCDASIVYGAEDMQFQNTTPAPVVIETYVDGDRLVVGLFGHTPPPGDHVFVKTTRLAYIHAPVVEQPDPTLPPASPPVVAQKPRLGYDVTVERVWTQGPRVLRSETVVSEHRAPRAKIVRVPDPLPALIGHPSPFGKGEGLVTWSHGSVGRGLVTWSHGWGGGGQVAGGQGRIAAIDDHGRSRTTHGHRPSASRVVSGSHKPLPLSEGGGVPDEGGEGAAP